MNLLRLCALMSSLVYVTVNDIFLSQVGYEGNLSGFLADYFGHDFKPRNGEPLRFRYVNGYLVNPSRVENQV